MKPLIAMLNSRYALKRARSAIAPEAIVTAAAAKTAWKKKNEAVLRLPLPLEPVPTMSLPARKNPFGSPPRVARTERQGVPDRQECQDTDTHVGQVLGQDIGRVLDSRQTTLQEGEARLHAEDENARQHNPDVVQGCLHGGRRILRLRGGRCGTHHQDGQQHAQCNDRLAIHGVTSMHSE